MSLRATEEPGLFNFLLAGKNVNHAELAFNQDLLHKIFTEATGSRPGLVFGECPWISAYTLVPSSAPLDRRIDFISLRIPAPTSEWLTNSVFTVFSLLGVCKQFRLSTFSNLTHPNRFRTCE